MAKRRMIWTKISTSVQVNEMSEFAQLLFTWMIPHADDYGVMKAHPKFLKAQVMPLSSRNFTEFQGAVDEMEKAGLIHAYEVDGEGPLIQFRRWEDHQTGLSRRTRTGKLPRFIDIHGSSQKFNEIHPEQNRTEQEQNLTGTEQEHQHQQNNDDVAHPYFAKNLEILIEVGVAEPTASECAGYPHVTPAYLENLVGQMGDAAGRGTRLGQGWLVTQIRNRREPSWR
jgi:hypothetical protein